MARTTAITRGSPLPFGATIKSRTGTCYSANFSIHSRRPPTLYLCTLSQRNKPLLDTKDVIEMPGRTGDIFHVEVHGLEGLVGYWYTVGSEEVPAILDPWARYIAKDEKLGRVGILGMSNDHFEWGIAFHQNSLENVIIYECHVGHMGGFRGMTEKVWYLKELGITAVEMLPIYEFSPAEGGAWGYCPVNFFAPYCKYGTNEDCVKAARELKILVRELHRNDIEVYLDVVYNHTSNENSLWSHCDVVDQYYILQPNKAGYPEHVNISGCGNTFSPNSPMMGEIIIESLRWWVTEYHVDGFRFDAGGVLCRKSDGTPLKDPPIVKAISEDPILKNCRLIVEPWDAGDSVGSPNFLSGKFPYGDRWFEWNPAFRDGIRRFIRGDECSAREFCRALRGSKNMYKRRKFGSLHSVNYICSHDGFSLYDLVSYKHRTNKDGYAEGTSFNCGFEGELSESNDSSAREEVRVLRNRQIRNLILALFLARGMPMLTMGDEYGASYGGNNNIWNLEDPSTDLNTSKEAQNAHDSFFRFVKQMIRFRTKFPMLGTGGLRDRSRGGISFEWCNESGVPFSAYNEKPITKCGHLVCFTIEDKPSQIMFYVAFNAQDRTRKLKLPSRAPWRIFVDTSATSPHDFREEALSSKYDGDTFAEYEIMPFTSVVLIHKDVIKDNGAHVNTIGIGSGKTDQGAEGTFL